MKFFSNLPKTNFSSTIGTFEISDFFTYLDVKALNLETGTVTIDSATTLVEASAATYSDPNGFWTFLVANKTINPFDLLSTNVDEFVQGNENKLNITLTPDLDGKTTGIAFPVGSIVVPYAGNAGASFVYGSTGNFNLNGPFAIVEESSFYDGNMVISEQYGGSDFIVVGNSPEKVLVIQKNTDGSYAWVQGYNVGGITYTGGLYVGNKKIAYDRIVQIVDPNDAKSIRREATSSKYLPDEEISKYPAISGATIGYTALDIVKNESKELKSYSPNALGTVRASFVSAKYI